MKYQLLTTDHQGYLLASNPRSILILDDDPNLRAALSSTLMSLFPGCRVTECVSADDAYLSISESRIDLIISDFDLGAGPSGITFWKWLSTKGPSIPFLMVSGHSQQEVFATLADRLPPPHFLPKPYSKGELKSEITLLLGKAPKESSAGANELGL